MVARQLFCALFTSVLGQVEEELPKKDATNFMSKLNGCLNRMLSSTTQFFTPFIACLLVRFLILKYMIFTCLQSI